MRERKRKAPKRPGAFVFYLSESDRTILDAASKLDGLSRSDVLRRAIRAYYRKLQRSERIAS